MLENEIITQLNSLKKITPRAEYASVSKLIITMSTKDKAFEIAPENRVTTPISELNSILPSPEFWAASKTSILNHPRTLTAKVMRAFSPKVFTRSAFNYGVSVALAGVLIALVIGGAGSFKTIPSIDNKTVATQAQNAIKDIDVRLEEAQYFNIAAKAASFALNDASTNGPAHASQTIIEYETENIEFNNPSNREVDELLREAAI